ncbi:hypothetical protein ACOME3_007913 [Neoechinorhynchus agilis]
MVNIKHDESEDITTLLEKLSDLLDSMNMFGTLASNCRRDHPTQLGRTLNSMIDTMKEMESMQNRYTNIQIPEDLLVIIDKFEDPQQSRIDEALKRRCEIVGHIEYLKGSKQELNTLMRTHFPELSEPFAQQIRNELRQSKNSTKENSNSSKYGTN